MGEKMKINSKILIVEDEAITAKAIESQIKKMGYDNTAIAINYKNAMKSIREDKPDLILLDIDLKSDYSGIDIANQKEVFNKIPIIYLTACTDLKTIENLIATNPKAYLSKPLRFEELQVAIALALDYKKGVIDIGYEFSYDLENRNLFQKQQPIKLSYKEKLLLERLIERDGECVPLKVLEFEIWGHEVKSESSLRTLVSSLRKKLNPKMIVNVTSFGYKLELPKDEM